MFGLLTFRYVKKVSAFRRLQKKCVDTVTEFTDINRRLFCSQSNIKLQSCYYFTTAPLIHTLQRNKPAACHLSYPMCLFLRSIVFCFSSLSADILMLSSSCRTKFLLFPPHGLKISYICIYIYAQCRRTRTGTHTHTSRSSRSARAATQQECNS